MTKLEKLKICDWTLAGVSCAMLASSIQLEVTHSDGMAWIWLHMVLGLTFFGMICWHLFLHFNWAKWFQRLKNQKSPVTRWLAIFGALTLVTALIAAAHWLSTCIHSGIGGWHGKLGFIFLALSIGHILKRIKFFKR